MPDNASLTDSPVFSLTCNLTGNNIRWFGPIIQNYSSKQPYISLYPIEYFQIKALKSKKEHVQTFEMNGQPQLLNVVQKYIAIEMKPMEETYKFDDISCKASVHVNLYKAWHVVRTSWNVCFKYATQCDKGERFYSQSL